VIITVTDNNAAVLITLQTINGSSIEMKVVNQFTSFNHHRYTTESIHAPNDFATKNAISVCQKVQISSKISLEILDFAIPYEFIYHSQLISTLYILGLLHAQDHCN